MVDVVVADSHGADASKILGENSFRNIYIAGDVTPEEIWDSARRKVELPMKLVREYIRQDGEALNPEKLYLEKKKKKVTKDFLKSIRTYYGGPDEGKAKEIMRVIDSLVPYYIDKKIEEAAGVAYGNYADFFKEHSKNFYLLPGNRDLYSAYFNIDIFENYFKGHCPKNKFIVSGKNAFFLYRNANFKGVEPVDFVNQKRREQLKVFEKNIKKKKYRKKKVILIGHEHLDAIKSLEEEMIKRYGIIIPGDRPLTNKIIHISKKPWSNPQIILAHLHFAFSCNPYNTHIEILPKEGKKYYSS